MLENKQINYEQNSVIIDGVDVSRCEFAEISKMIRPNQVKPSVKCKILKDLNQVFHCTCQYNKNCYYKQLKRKQQECEVLGQAYLETNELLQEKTKECTNLKSENEELKSDLTDLSKIIDCKNGTILTFKEQLDKLKSENEGLKEKIMYLESEIDRLNG